MEQMTVTELYTLKETIASENFCGSDISVGSASKDWSIYRETWQRIARDGI